MLTLGSIKLITFKNQIFFGHICIFRGGGPGWAGWAAAHPIFEGKPLGEEKFWHKKQKVSGG